MAEMTNFSKDHGHATIIGRRNHIVIPHTSTWLNGSGGTCVSRR
jgi:hypothetical protein